MRKISLCLLFLAVGFAGTTFAQTASKQKLAVYVGGNGDNAVKKVVGSKLTAAITSNSNYIAVERTSEFLAQLRNELFYQRTGNVDDKQIADFGKQMGVNAVCIAEVTNGMFGSTFVSARILDVTTGLVTAAAEEYGVLNDMSPTVSLSEKLATNLCNTIGYELGDCTKLAVYVGGDGSDVVKKVIGSHLVSSIIGNGYYSAVERTNAFLAEVGKEYDYQQTRNVNDNELTRLGKQFGVKIVCAAEITEGFGSHFISVRLIDVQSGQVLYTAESDKKLSSAYDLHILASNLSTNLMKKIVTCTKSGKKQRYSSSCCNKSDNNLNGVCIDVFELLKRDPNNQAALDVAEKIDLLKVIKIRYGLDIYLIKEASFSMKNDYPSGNYRLATDAELKAIPQKYLEKLCGYNNKIITQNSSVCCGTLSSFKPSDRLFDKLWNWKETIYYFSISSMEQRKGELWKQYEYKDSAEKYGSSECRRIKDFSMILIKQ